ncbi:MAG: hypothetical protein ABSB74_07650 [Tepidisphaeraceae bacterium]
MPTLAIMFTVTTYGTWLRGDARGWVNDGIVFPPDPQLEHADHKRLKYPPYYFPRDLRLEVGQAIGESLISRMGIIILALCVQSWHAHFVTAATPRDVSEIVKCAKDAARWKLQPDRPIWATDYDKRFCFDPMSVRTRIDYVERHNVRDHLPPRPWKFIRDWHEPTITPFSPR